MKSKAVSALLVLVGVVFALDILGLVLTAAFTTTVGDVMGMPGTGEPSGAWLTTMLLTYHSWALPGGFLILGGIGLWNGQRWARKLLSIIAVINGVVGLLYMGCNMRTRGVADSAGTFLRTIGYIALLLHMQRPSINAQREHAEASKGIVS